MEKYCISIDWLQVYCKRNYLCPWNEVSDEKSTRIQTFEGRMGKYEVRQRDYGSNLWCVILDLYRDKLKLAEICMEPRVSVIAKDACTVKLENRVLYYINWYDLLKDILAALKLTYVGVTRIDVCWDCNRLSNGMSVQTFLMDFFAHTPFVEGHIIRSGSRRVQIHAAKSATGATTINGMKWGSPSSDVSVYCYNKTLELLEKKDKPWIREAWEKAGLVSVWTKEQWDKLTEMKKKRAVATGDSMDFVQTPVWRFEISIKGHGKDLLSVDTGELFRIDLSTIATQEKVESLFETYAMKYLDFRISKGEKRLREYHPMDLFKLSEVNDVRAVSLCRYADTGRMETICANKLETLHAQYADLAPEIRSSIEYSVAFLRTIAGEKRAVVMANTQKRYIDYMKAKETVRAFDRLYFEAVLEAKKKRLELSAKNLRDCMYNILEASVKMPAMLQYESPQVKRGEIRKQ